jgi:hypothetical protein
MFWDEVDATGAESEVFRLDHIVVLENGQNVHEQHSIKIVGNSTAIVNLSSHKLD